MQKSQAGTSRTSGESGPTNPIVDHLHTFLHLTTQAPLETVCRSSLYVLARVPAARQAVLEYLATFYKVATFLHLRYNLNVKNSHYAAASGADLTAEANNLIQINMAIEIIENALGDLLKGEADSDSNELWSIELTRWLADMMGDIVTNTAATCADSMQGLNPEEIASFKSPTINDGLEIWSRQCKPAQSVLELILKCFKTSSNSKSEILDILLDTSARYPKKYDWVLVYFSCLDTEQMFRKLLTLEFKELARSPQAQFSRINVVSFFAKSFPKIVCEEIASLLSDVYPTDERALFILRLAAQSSPLLSLILEQLLDLDSNNKYQRVLSLKLKSLIENESVSIRNELFACLNQINSSIGVFEILVRLLDILSLDNRPPKNDFQKNYSMMYFDQLISNIYTTKSNQLDLASESVGFLKSLNQIDGHSFGAVVDSMIQCLTRITRRDDKIQLELIYRLILLVMINTNEFKAGLIMRQLLTIDNKPGAKISSCYGTEENILIKIRQEVGSFHDGCFNDAVKSKVSYLSNVDPDDGLLEAFVNNLVLVFEWDVHNKYFMNQSLANVLLDRECFVGLISQLEVDKPHSLALMELFNRVFKLDDEDLVTLKLTIPDLLKCSNVFVRYFFDLTEFIDEVNVVKKVKEINELLNLVENTVCYQFNSVDESNPYRNILLRNLVERLFETISSDKQKKSAPETPSQEMFDENSNLFNSNIETINSELISNKSRLKAVRNSLVDSEFVKRNRVQLKNQFKSVRNWAILNFLEAIVSSKEAEIEQKLMSEQLGNLADLLVQNILVEQHFVDYQWSSSGNLSGVEIDESFESELDSIKLFVERDMYVQNKIENPVDNQILWILLELIATDEQALIRVGPIIRSLLASVIIQWESLQETPTKNIPKTLGITTRLLNIINRAPDFLIKPLCYIVDIVPLLSSYETFIALMIIWRNLKKKMVPIPHPKSGSTEANKPSDIKHLRYIFQKNISKLSCLYAKFFRP